MTQVLKVYFFDLSGNILPQYEIQTTISDSDVNVLAGLVAQGYPQNKQITYSFPGSTTGNPIQTASQVYTQIQSAMNQISYLSSNAGAGTTETSSFVGQIPGQNVIFDIVAGNGLVLNRVILSSSDYTLLVSNAQANVAVSNVSSTTSPVNLTYDRLEAQIVLSGVTSIPASQSAGLTVTQATQNFSVAVKNNSNTQQTFILSQSDYISLYSTQLNSIISSAPTQASTNATLSNVLSFIVSSTGVSTAQQTAQPTIKTVPTNTSNQGITLEQQQIPFGTYTVVVKNSNGTFNILGSGTTVQWLTLSDIQTLISDGYTINDPNNILVAPTPPTGTVTIQGNANSDPTTPTGTQTIPVATYTNGQLATLLASQTKQLAGSGVPNPMGSTGQYNNTQDIKKNPLGFIVALFTGGFAASLIIPKISKAKKHLRSSKRYGK